MFVTVAEDVLTAMISLRYGSGWGHGRFGTSPRWITA